MENIMDINDKIDLFTIDTVEEGFFKKVIRKGKVKRKVVFFVRFV